MELLSPQIDLPESNKISSKIFVLNINANSRPRAGGGAHKGLTINIMPTFLCLYNFAVFCRTFREFGGMSPRSLPFVPMV